VLHDPAFWWLTWAFTLSALAAVAITIHIIPYMLDRGYGAGFAVGTASLIGAMKFPGRLLFAPLEALALAALFGAANGAITLAENYGLAQYGSISGVLALFLSGAQALTPIGAGALYAGFGSYEPVNWILAALSLASVASVSQVRVQSWPKYAVE
jgi:hypothetical protein